MIFAIMHIFGLQLKMAAITLGQPTYTYTIVHPWFNMKHPTNIAAFQSVVLKIQNKKINDGKYRDAKFCVSTKWER